MNPVIRHFLPSVVRGVYRFDDDFSHIDSDQENSRFVEGKMRFLPLNAAKQFKQVLEWNDNFKTAQQALTLPLAQTQITKARAKSFFGSHSYFKDALGSAEEIKSSDKYLEIQFVRKILAPLLNDKGTGMVRPQHKVGSYFVDFVIEGTDKYALEVDGFGKFKHKLDLDDFIKRQNYIVSQGWRIVRFTYGQIMNTPKITLRNLHDLFKDDPQLRHQLNKQHTENTPDLFSFDNSVQPIELVNDFYRVQDYFAQTVLEDVGDSKTVQIEDGFGFGFPFVATAISALYEFLQAIESVVEIDFDLPKVEITGEGCLPDWELSFHNLITVSQTKKPAVHKFDSKTVRLSNAVIPTPSREAGEIRFRHNLSLNEIKDRLDYFARTIFGFSGTKPFQDRILQRVFDGQNVLGISATGSGKSFCFWLPALLRPGLTIIICPLRSLMRDQRLTLRNYGIASVEFINSDIDQLSQRRMMEEARLGYIRLLYIAPERLRIKKFLSELERLQESVPINFLAIDEAHCISEWGHDFRPSYLKLPLVHERLSKSNKELSLIALTATAGQQVEQDMRGILKLREEEVLREKVADRERFSYQIVPVREGVDKVNAYREILMQHLPKALTQESLLELLQQKNKRDEKALGIIFCIYADPHGKNSVRDGIAHYLYETMGVLEPDRCFESTGMLKKYCKDAYFTGKVRAFASKTPTLCPQCKSYAYTSCPSEKIATEDKEEDEENASPDVATGLKICAVGHQFSGKGVDKPEKWESRVRRNQEDFKVGLFDILVATKGFGMGIDKSSVRFVVHTSLSSGIESWYQEVGRAGRDGERAHIVLLVDPPNEACRKELDDQKQIDGEDIKRPQCSYRRGCPHGKASLCDYGKQHMFITSSYPGAGTDAVSALRVLDKLILSRESSNEGTVVINSSDKYLSRDELSLYRLTVLGLIEDYVITYTPNPRFDVQFTLQDLPSRQVALDKIRMGMNKLLAEYFSHFEDWHGRNIEHELESRTKNYQPLEKFSAKLQQFQTFQRYGSLFQMVYRYLLLLLDHTYKNVVKMRYDMLWNLDGVVKTDGCRRVSFLGHFGEKWPETSKCQCCDNCAPSLEFPDKRHAPVANTSILEKQLELERIYRQKEFDLVVLRQIVDDFAEYPTAQYREARAVLEGDANHLPALFLAREFSPSDEKKGNATRLLRTANQKRIPLEQVKDLYQTSPRHFISDMLLTLNEADGACDCQEGWAFLAQEAKQSIHWQSEEVSRMGECLEFYLLVDDDTLPDVTTSIKSKISELENIFYA